MSKWFLEIGDETVGPLTSSEVSNLKDSAGITAETLVWQEGDQDKKVALAKSELAPVLEQKSGVMCEFCHDIYSFDEIIQIQDQNCCYKCKDEVLVRLQENTLDNPNIYRYGGFWVRFGASILDGLILLPLLYGVGFLVGYIVSPEPLSTEYWVMTISLQIFQFAISFLYTVLLLWKKQATVGMMATGLIVVDARNDYGPVSFGKASARWASAIISGLILYIGYWIMLFDQEKRTLHDHIAGTRIIYKKK
ncbi:RDD family protein [Lentisphaerota bacterium WC36G]|nr:RDD family protein [Lentisphaerae bacterium WC36]